MSEAVRREARNRIRQHSGAPIGFGEITRPYGVLQLSELIWVIPRYQESTCSLTTHSPEARGLSAKTIDAARGPGRQGQLITG